MENELIKQKPKAIFFDLSGTILDSHAIDVEAIDSILAKYGMPKLADGTRDKKEKGKSMKENFPNFFGMGNAERAYNEYLNYLLDNIERMPLINNILKTLEYCKSNGIKAIIVSNRDKIFVDAVLEKFGIQKYFDGVITPNDVDGITKPDPRILTSSFEEFNLNPTKDTLLFMGDAFADIRCAFKSGCVPILFTEISKDEINSKNLERLKKVNPKNPIREIKLQSKFIELLDKSKELWEEKPKIKMTYIGAGGKIGQKAVQMICSQIPDDSNVEIILIGSDSEGSLPRLNGYIQDLIGSLALQGKRANINFVATNDYSQTKDSNIVICSAGKCATAEEKEKYKLQDPSGRMVQSFVNAEMIKNITLKLQDHCPNALFTIVTNQVDMMCHIARNTAPEMKIIGLSGGVDSSRLKQTTKEILGFDCEGIMIGYHNASMTLLTNSFRTKEGQTIFPVTIGEEKFSDDELQEGFLEIEKQKLETIITKTRTLGGKIAENQGAGSTNGKDTGASILPATAIAQLVNGYCFGISFVESYNTFITNPETAHHYGISQNSALSVPLIVKKGEIEISTDVFLLEAEKVLMRKAQASLNKDLDLLLSDVKAEKVLMKEAQTSLLH